MMTPMFTGFTAVLDDPDTRVNAKPWLVDVEGLDIDALSDADAVALHPVQDSDLPPAMPYVDGVDPSENEIDLAGLPVRPFDHMLTLDDDGFMNGLINDFDVQVAPVQADRFAELPPVLPVMVAGVEDLDPAVIDFDLADQPVQVFDHMITLGDDGFLLDQTDGGYVLAGLDLVGATVEAPPVMPALDDDDFLVSKDSDVPQVFPGIDEFDPAAVGFELADQPVQLFDHMMTIDDDGFLLGPTDDLGRLHDHDGWLF